MGETQICPKTPQYSNSGRTAVFIPVLRPPYWKGRFNFGGIPVFMGFLQDTFQDLRWEFLAFGPVPEDCGNYHNA